MKLATILTVLQSLALATLIAAVPVDIAARLREQQRERRKVSELDSTAAPEQYMRGLFEKLTDESGKPKNPAEDPTNIWCLFDKDVKDWQHREQPRTGDRCSIKHRFLFSSESVTQEESTHNVPLHRAILRTYAQVIPRLVSQGGAMVEVAVFARAVGNSTAGRVYAGSDILLVTSNSSGWLELNITEGIATLWPPVQERSIEIEVEMSVDCKSVRKVPVSLVDPASIPLESLKKRERHLSLQPMLLVFMNDEQVRQRIEEDKIPIGPEGAIIDDSNTTESNETSEARERRSGTPICGIEDFQVHFNTLYMREVLAPISYNAKKCSGSCDHTSLTRKSHLATNHAKIMASADIIHRINPDAYFRHETQEPCCVPTVYEPLSLLLKKNGSVVYELYPSMRVSQCGCR